MQTELQSLRKKWHLIYNEAKVIAVAMIIDPVFPVTRKRKRKSFFDDSDDDKVSGEDSLIQTDEHRFKEEMLFSFRNKYHYTYPNTYIALYHSHAKVTSNTHTHTHKNKKLLTIPLRLLPR